MQYLQARQQVLKTAQEILAARLVIGTWGNVSMRIPGEELMVITPSGMDYEILTPEDMALVDFQQELVEGPYQPSTETPMHSEIYKRRPDAGAIVHVHSPYAAAFAVAGQPIPVVLEETAQAIGHPVMVAPYARCGTRQLASSAAATLGENGRAVLLSMHGLLTLGPDLKEALKVCYVVEKTAMVALYAKTLGPVPCLDDDDVKLLHRKFQSYQQKKKD